MGKQLWKRRPLTEMQRMELEGVNREHALAARRIRELEAQPERDEEDEDELSNWRALHAQREGRLNAVIHGFSKWNKVLSNRWKDEDRHFPDNVHGLISLSDLEHHVFSTRDVGRLLGVQQLEVISRGMHPGATQNRLAHSMGVMHLAGRIAKRLKLPPKIIQEIRFAGLLHDLGHPAFSHAMEDELRKRFPGGHEEATQEIIRNGEAGKRIREAGFDLEAVLAHARGEGVGGRIVDWADRLDYLQRDFAHTFGPSRTIARRLFIDLNQFTSSLVLRGNKLCVPANKQHLAKRFAEWRTMMYANLYWHPAEMIPRELLKRAVKKGLRRGVIKQGHLFQDSDEVLLPKLAKAQISEAGDLTYSNPMAEHDPILTAPFTYLTSAGRAAIREKGFTKRLEQRIQQATGVRPIVFATPDFEKPLNYDVAYADGRVVSKTYAPVPQEGKKYLLVSMPKAAKEKHAIAQQVVFEAMKGLLKRKPPLISFHGVYVLPSFEGELPFSVQPLLRKPWARTRNRHGPLKKS